MTPAEMCERCAVLVEEASRGPGGLTWLRNIATAIRALPVEEAPLTPREKLRRVREAREVLATARIAVPRQYYVVSATTRECLGDWATRGAKGKHIGRAWARKGAGIEHTDLEGDDARTWVLDTLRAEGWDVVEEGEGDG